MRMKTIMTVAATLLLTAGMARAQHIWEDSAGWWDAHFTSGKNAPRYNAQEVSLDMFGSYINPEGKFDELFETDIHHGSWGGGAGVNYFCSRNLGLGADFNISSKTDDLNLVDQVTGNVILRLPLGDSGFAPYGFGGGGRAISPQWDWVYGGGVGLEYRFNPSTGIFSDARYLWANKGTEFNRLLIRFGLRLTF